MRGELRKDMIYVIVRKNHMRERGTVQMYHKLQVARRKHICAMQCFSPPYARAQKSNILHVLAVQFLPVTIETQTNCVHQANIG